jgi:hypothetical protein
MSVLSRWWHPWRRWAGARIREIRQTSQRRRSGIPDILIFRNPADITEEEIRYSWHSYLQDPADITEEEIRYSRHSYLQESGRHHRRGDQVFLTFLSSAILKFVRIRLPDINRQTSQRRRSGIPDILVFRNPEVRQD